VVLASAGSGDRRRRRAARGWDDRHQPGPERGRGRAVGRLEDVGLRLLAQRRRDAQLHAAADPRAAGLVTLEDAPAQVLAGLTVDPGPHPIAGLEPGILLDGPEHGRPDPFVAARGLGA